MSKPVLACGGYSGCDCLAIINNKKVFGELQQARFDLLNQTITGVAAFFHQKDSSLIDNFKNMDSLRIVLTNEYGNKMEYIAKGITLEKLEVDFSIDRIVFELEYELKYDALIIEDTSNKDYNNL